MVVNMSFETMSVSCDFIFSLGFIAIYHRYDIHSVWISEQISTFFTVGSPSDVDQVCLSHSEREVCHCGLLHIDEDQVIQH